MKFIVTCLIILLTTFVAAAQRPFALVLGTAQDAGIPQMGCESPFCKKAWNDPRLRRSVSSIAIVDRLSRKRWIFDATPDLPLQFERLKTATGDFSNGLAGIFLTHAHIGHYTGLMYLGRESMNAKDVNVYAMPRMKTVLESNAPWSQLVGLKNIVLTPLFDGKSVALVDKLTVEPFLVPHRDEFSETVGFRVKSGSKSLIYIPDIDKWEKWPTKLADVVRENDFVLIDGTFFADGEINRPMNEVPHPFVTETMELLRDLPKEERAKVIFIHFNHSNPLVQRDRPALKILKSKGFGVAVEGMKFEL